MRLLVADDDRAVRNLLQRQLAKGGYEIVLASDGDEAWAALQSGNIRLAVLDWHMPRLDGIEICRRLHELGGPTYAIMLTADEGVNSVTKALDAGANDYIVKPWLESVLLARVNVGARTITMQAHLAQAQKLESIGRLAAGIAHELNTPMQYVGDNLRFLSDSVGDLLRLIGSYRTLVSDIAIASAGNVEDCVNRAAVLEQESDLPYLESEIPKSFMQSLDGVARVSKIVGAMKVFSHSHAEEKEAIDLNRAIQNTVTVAHNELKGVAEMVTDFDSALPPVRCLPGDFSQVILNIAVNAVHAIAEVVDKNTGEKGTITIATRQAGDWAEIRISDTGCGIPEEHRSKVFDHFFTTKEVGQGSGQGLAIAHAIITEKHGGTITFESEIGKGTSFIIRLPIEPETSVAAETPQPMDSYSPC